MNQNTSYRNNFLRWHRNVLSLVLVLGILTIICAFFLGAMTDQPRIISVVTLILQISPILVVLTVISIVFFILGSVFPKSKDPVLYINNKMEEEMANACIAQTICTLKKAYELNTDFPSVPWNLTRIFEERLEGINHIKNYGLAAYLSNQIGLLQKNSQKKIVKTLNDCLREGKVTTQKNAKICIDSLFITLAIMEKQHYNKYVYKKIKKIYNELRVALNEEYLGYLHRREEEDTSLAFMLIRGLNKNK